MLPINILHVIPKLSVGGVENQLALILQKYDRKKFHPFVCCISGKGEIGTDIESRGIEVIYLNKLKHKFDWTIVKDIHKLIRSCSIKIVRTHQYHANLYGRLAAFSAKVPCVVASVHNIYTIDKKFHRRLINRYLAGVTDKIITVSKAVKNDVLEYDGIPEDKIMVIYNGIEMERFSDIKSSVREELGLSNEIPVIGTVGRLTPQKGIKYLIEATSKLTQTFPRIVLLIAGDGPLREDLENYAKILNMGGNVIFLGTRRDIPAVLSAMDIFILPSMWEGMSNALIEAMAAAKPVISTNIAPNREIVDSEKVGILIPPKNSDEIVRAIKFLLKNKEMLKRLGEAAKIKIISDFNIDKTVKTYESLFEDILRNHGIAI